MSVQETVPWALIDRPKRLTCAVEVESQGMSEMSQFFIFSYPFIIQELGGGGKSNSVNVSDVGVRMRS